MQSRGLLLAVVALAALSGAIWWSNQKAEDDKKNPKEAGKTKLIQMLEADVVDIQIQRKNEPALVLHKDVKTNRWEMVSEPKYRLDQEMVTTLVTNSATVPTDKVLEESAADVAQYGLDPAMITLELKDKNGKTDKLLIGDETPIGGLFYARKANEKKVYAIASYQKTGIDKTAADLRDKRLLTLEEAKLSKMELVRKAETIEFAKNSKGDWQVVKPAPMRTDALTADELYRKARDTRFEPQLSPEDTKKFAAAFGSGTPIGTLKLSDGAASQTLEVRRTKEAGLLAKSSAVDGIHKVPDDVGVAMDKGLEDFRNKKLFDFGFEEPVRIELKLNGKTTVLEHQGNDWLIGGKKMDGVPVQALMGDLRGFSALKPVKSGFTTASSEIVVTQKDGKTTERLLISKTGNFHYAKRDGEAAEYEIDPKSLTDLEAAVAAIQAPGAGKK